MSFEPDFVPYPSSTGIDAMEPDLFFAPDPQLAFAPPPESFDQDVDDDEEIDLELSFKEFDDFFATFGDTIPVAPTLSAATDSTDSTESVYSSQSQYSCDFTLSEYSSIPSEIESLGSAYDGLYSTPAPVYAAAFSDPLPSILPGSAAVQAVAVQESASPFSPVHVVLDEAHEIDGPVKRFKCHWHKCSHSSARLHNLKTHFKTHYKEAPFECGTCRHRFTRKHDLKRHCLKIHNEQMSSSSDASSISKPTFESMPEQPDPFHHGITFNGDPSTMLTAYPGYDAAVDLPENIIPWLLGA